jgi:hypothetical protein
LTEIQVTTKTSTPVTLTSTGYTYFLVSSAGAIDNLGQGVTAAVANAGLTITNAGTLTGGVSGIQVTNTPGGYISTQHIERYDAGTGVVIQAGGTLTNSGTIIGGGGSSTYQLTDYHNNYELTQYAFNGGTGVDIDGFGKNFGDIIGGAGAYARVIATNGGVGIDLSGGTFSNSGTITGGAGGSAALSVFDNAYGGQGATGINLSGGATLINTGIIAGGAGGAAVKTSGNGGAGVAVDGGTLIAFGTISGGAGVIGGSAGTNLAKAASANGDAVRFGGAGRLVVERGAVFNGDVVGDSGASDVLELAAGTLGTGSYNFSGIGSNFSGFNTIALDAGPTWSLAGALLGETITGLTQFDTLDLTNTIANGISIVNGTAVLFNGTTDLGTIQLTGSFPFAYLDVISNGAGGTDLLDIANEISGTVATGVTLNSASTTVFSHGLIENSTGPAVSAPTGANWILVNYGQILGGSFAGVTLANGGTITNSVSGTISGGDNAIAIATAAGSVNNAGTIIATGGDAIYFGHGGMVSNSGKLAGAANGIAVLGASAAVSNTGSISTSGGDGMYFNAGATISNTGTGNIAGSTYGILVTGAAGTLGNAGIITGQSEAGVEFAQDGSIGNTGTLMSSLAAGLVLGDGGAVSNSSTGHISGATDGVFVQGAAGTLVNDGSISSANGDAVYFGAGGSISNSGSITGRADGIVLHNSAGSIGNTGTIMGSLAAGLLLGDGGAVSNSSTGHISGATDAVSVEGAAGTLVNAGGISSTTGDAVYFGADGSVSNSGSIVGAANGIDILNDAGSVGNMGSISGKSGDGVLLGDGGTVSQSSGATISGATFGVFVQNAAGTVTNAGLITGTSKYGIDLGAGGTVVNTGTINGNGVAVSFGGAGGDLLALGAGAAFDGNVTASGTGNTLELMNAGSAGTLSGFGTKYSGFQTIALDAGANWDIAGALFGETVTGFGGTDTLDLTNIIANSETLADGVLTLSENGVTVGTLNLAGDFLPGDLVLGSDGHGGTAINLVGNIGGTYGSGITLSGQLTTITNTASISNTGVAVYGAPGSARTVVNAGSLHSGNSDGVNLAGGGAVSNLASGNIYGDVYGVVIGGAGTVSNAGTIDGASFAGIRLNDGGYISNAIHGTISGDYGVQIQGATAAVVNDGLILGILRGVEVSGNGDSVTNSVTGTISSRNAAAMGAYGANDTLVNAGTVLNSGFSPTVSMLYTGTLINGGYIGAGGQGRSAAFYGGASRLVLDPGGTFAGSVVAYGAGNVLELGAGASAGTVSGIGSKYVDFGTIVVDLGAAWTISGALTGETISGLGGGDTLDFTNVVANSESYSGGVLTLYENGTYAGAAKISGQYIPGHLSLSSDGNGTTIAVAAEIITGTITNGITLDDSATTIAAGAMVSGNGKAAVYGSYGPFWQVVNFGTVSNSVENGIYLGLGDVTNAASGQIFSQFGAGVELAQGTIVNAGTIDSTSGRGVYIVGRGSATVINAGTIIGGGGTAVLLANDYQESRLIIDPGAVFVGSVEAQPFETTDVLELASGNSAGTLTGIGSQFTGFSTIQIDTGASWTLAGNLAGFNNDTISGFTGRDTIDVTSFAAAPGTIELGSSDVLTVGDLALTFTSADTGELFAIASDGHGGTDITTDTLCYLRGTRILTPTGTLPVEDIAIGDLLVTRFSGMAKVKWIGRQSFDLRFVQDNRDRLPVRIRAGALGEKLPARDLYVSPGHSMLLENTLVLARNLVNGVSITQETGPENNPAIIDYFQIELDRHDCVIAEGTWSETYADGPGMRGQFQNAAEFYALYPDQPPPQQLELCAPRPERAKLDAALRPVVARASEGILPGALEGYIDFVDTWRIEGWALDQDHPELPVLLEIWVEDRLLGTVLACDHRADLLDVGKNDGNCAFIHHLPTRLPEGELRIVRAADGAALQVSGHCQTKAEATTPVSKSAALSVVA